MDARDAKKLTLMAKIRKAAEEGQESIRVMVGQSPDYDLQNSLQSLGFKTNMNQISDQSTNWNQAYVLEISWA